jgi:rhodanese-related sulfurtransferase
MCLRLNREECIIAGPSSGMVLVGALRMVPDEPGNVLVVIFPDDIFKYASSICRHFPDLCPASGDTATAVPSPHEQLFAEMIENLKNPYDSVRPTVLSTELESSSPPMVVDVRPKEMYDEVYMGISVNIPQAELPGRLDELPEDRDAPIVMVCGIGKFSKHTTLYLKSLGYRNVRSMKGGIGEWVRKGQATMSNVAPES